MNLRLRVEKIFTHLSMIFWMNPKMKIFLAGLTTHEDLGQNPICLIILQNV